MKRIYLFAAVTAIALAACTKTETTGVSEGNLIKFDNAFVGNPTKASVTDLTKDNISHFYVFGTKDADNTFFDNVLVKKNGSAWTYEDLQEWKQATYMFAAYSNGGTSTDGVKIDNASWDGSNLTISDYTVDQKDLVASISTSDINSENSPVEFTFKHTLSMIKFTLKSTLGDGDNAITVSDFTVTGLKDKATLTYTASGASWGTPSDDKTLSNGDITVTTTTPGESDSFVVIPQSVSNMSVRFAATIAGFSSKNLIATISDEWQPGFRYNYEATITGKNMDVIEFTLTDVTSWDDTDLKTPIDTPINKQ